MADIRFVLIATGTKATDPSVRTVSDFTEMAANRVRAIIRRVSSKSPGVYKDAELRFVHFNFGEDKVQAYGFDPSKVTTDWRRHTFPWVDLASFSPTGDAAFDPKTFVDAPAVPDTMSIVHLYHSVRGAPPGSVLEVSIFSHAWVQGPVLVNSTDTKLPDFSPNNPQRTSADADGRLRTDFFPNMGEDPTVESSGPIKSGGKNALEEFKTALYARLDVYAEGVADC